MDKNEQLTERNKELNCLYEIDKAGVEQKNLDEYFQKIIISVQNGFQYVNLVRVEINYNNQVYRSSYFEKTKHFLKQNIEINNDIKGSLTVYYASENLPENNPFLKEENRLMFSIAKRISDFLYKYEHAENCINRNKNLSSENINHNEIRKNILSKLCKCINLKELGISALYLIGSTKNNTAGINSDIDLIVHYDGLKESIEKINMWFSGWETCLNEYENQIKIQKIFDLHFINDKDIDSKTSYAVMIDSLNNSAKLLLKDEG